MSVVLFILFCLAQEGLSGSISVRDCPTLSLHCTMSVVLSVRISFSISLIFCNQLLILFVSCPKAGYIPP